MIGLSQGFELGSQPRVLASEGHFVVATGLVQPFNAAGNRLFGLDQVTIELIQLTVLFFQFRISAFESGQAVIQCVNVILKCAAA